MKIIIGCGGTKQRIAAPAFELYIGGVFKASFDWAASITSHRSIFILSAKYGLIHCRREIEPYDSKMGTPSQIISPGEICQQVSELGLLEEEPLLVSLGKPYRRILEPSLNRFHRLLDHWTLPNDRIGYQKAWFTRNKGRLPQTLKSIYLNP